jgi:hypothetical protein
LKARSEFAYVSPPGSSGWKMLGFYTLETRSRPFDAVAAS